MPETEKKREYLSCDIAAVVCGLALFAFLFLTANRFIGTHDEVFYYTVPQRVLQGDRFLVDEWHLSQLAYIFNILPYWVYCTFAGGTEGLILAMRYVFIAADLLFYAFMYVKLRRFRFAGVCAAALFCGLLPQAICSVSYYTVSTMAFAAICIFLLIDTGSPGAVKSVFAGVLLACAVLAEPLLIFVFGVYFIAVAVREIRLRRKRPFAEALSFVLNKKTFLRIFAGAFSVFVVFMAYLLFSGTLRALPQVLPYLLKDGNYTTGLLDGALLLRTIRFYGAVPFAGLCVSLGAAAVYRLMRKKNERLRQVVFAAVCVFAAWCYLHAAFNADFISMVELHEFPLLFWGPAVCLLCNEKNIRAEAVVLAGVLFSVFVDVSSANVLGSGGRIVFLGAALCLPTLWKEIFAARPARQTAKNKQTSAASSKVHKRILCTAAAAFCLIFSLWNLGFVYIEGLFKPQNTGFFEGEDAVLSVKLERGPYKGIVTSARIAEYYEKTLRDMDTLKLLADGKAIALPENIFYAYLYLDQPYGVPSVWCLSYEAQYADYWKARPEKRPAYIYIPSYDTFFFVPHENMRVIEHLSRYMEYEVTEAEVGLIYRVTGWKL